MSFILESIKKAERERKLGQEVPSISIEYSGKRIKSNNHNFMQWWLLSLGIVITALVVWATTYYFTNKNNTDSKQISETVSKDVKDSKSDEEILTLQTVKTQKRDIAITPVKNVHQSELKMVELIDKQPLANQNDSLQFNKNIHYQVAESIEPEIVNSDVEQTNQNNTLSVLPDIEKPIESENNTVTKKQELVAIYSDFAEAQSANDEKNAESSSVHKDAIDESLVEIQNASFVEPDFTSQNKTNKNLEQENTSVAYKTAVSTGVPSYGELPYDIQEQIPDFKVSVHMFHDDPNQRRIRINGNMYTEGKTLQQDLALVEITRYGAVFDYQGHLFRLNVR